VSSAAVGSTDMGNVSKWVPSIHPMIAVAPPNVPLHSPDFTAHAVSANADRAVVEGAKSLALTGVDVWTDGGLLDAVRAEFDTARSQ
ncbi:MAG TPA: hypothetical protein VM618_11215, partial [Acidimicrobiia bacterium]|nr:hypothetical protein [Acidimicrobiia bacterium]